MTVHFRGDYGHGALNLPGHMSVEIKISEEDLRGFSQQAQDALRAATNRYATDVIEEANRIEAGRSSGRGKPEVTRGMVDDAVLLLRRGLGAPRRNMRLRLLRVAAAVLPLLVGVTYDPTKLQSGTYMIVFVVLVAVAILAVTLSVLTDA